MTYLFYLPFNDNTAVCDVTCFNVSKKSNNNLIKMDRSTLPSHKIDAIQKMGRH